MTAAPSAGAAWAAPGKLMIAGEYAVLGDSPEAVALAVAVEPGVRARAEPSAGWRLAREDDGLEWAAGQPAPEGLRFIHAAWAQARALLDRAGVAPRRLVTRGSALVGEPAAGKRGVGGSASATVAVTALLCDLAGVDPLHARDEVLRLALAAHRTAQGGRGSGYDVATVLWGGLVCWRPTAANGAGAAKRMPWPAGLALHAAFSGRGARTTSFIERVERLDAADHTALTQELAHLGACAHELVDAFADADFAALSCAARRCHAELAAWDRRHDLGVITSEVAQMVAVAEQHGVAAKVSGAGGGDSVIALTDDRERLDALASAWQARGFLPLPVQRTDEGLRRC